MKNKIISFSFLLAALFGVTSGVVLGTNQQQAIAANATTVITVKSDQTYIDSYYSSVNLNQTGDLLKSALESLLKSERKGSFSYGTLQTSAFPYTDVDPNRPNGGYIVSFYSGTPVKGYSGMNKEHTWPDSHGGNKIENDPHVIRPTLTSENNDRGNEYYAASSSNGWDPATFSNPKYRGIAARIIFYGATVGSSSGLVLEDVGRTQGSGTGNRMGKLGDLLKWNLEYPIDQTEIIRNETLDKSLNWNRNPFIDDPSLACKIWGSTNSNTEQICAAYSEPPTAITVTPSTATVNVGNTQTLTLNVTPSTASKNVTWTSSNTSVATVSNGVVTPKAVGTATITATSTLDNTVKGSATITVTNDPIPVTGVTLDKSSYNISLGSTTTLTATITPSSATNKNVIWSILDTTVASISSTGVVTPKKLGSTTVTVETVDGGFKKTATLNVIEKPAVTSITANFHNSSDNNAGTGGVTANNINNGVTGTNAFIGFNNAPVVKDVKNVTQGYLPRAKGFAIGSSNNAGTVTLVLNEDYYAAKVEVKFNEAGQGTQAITLSGNKAISNTTTGTFGSSGSNPSSGTAYTIEFTEPASEITIGAAKRSALVELTIYFAVETDYVELATSWAEGFINKTNEACLAQSKALFEAVWGEVKTSYNALPNLAKEVIYTTEANGNGTVIEEAVARYIQIVSRYELESFISEIVYEPTQQRVAPSYDLSIPTIVFASLVFISLGAAFVYILKRKQVK